MKKQVGLALVLALVVGCGGSDGSVGQSGQNGAAGPAGPQGPAGPAGTNGTNGTNGADGTNGTNGTDGANGTDGSDGATIHTGEGAPADSLGNDGDLYIDSESRNVYKKDGGTWTLLMDLNSGAPGTSMHAGSGAPDSSVGQDGDLYVDVDTGDLYRRSGATWDVIGNIKGEPGDAGSDGASIHTGTGLPSAGLGNDGDLYIDSGSGDLFSKSGGTWSVVGNLQGAPGQDGSAWLTGNGEPDPSLGNEGDVYFDWDTGNAYVKGADAWELMGTFANYQLAGLTWFAFGMSGVPDWLPLEVVDSFVAGPERVTATFGFTAEGQHGRLAFNTVGGFFSAGTNLSAFDEIEVATTASGPAYDATEGIVVELSQGQGAAGCAYLVPAGGVLNLWAPEFCHPGGATPADVLTDVAQVQVGIVSSGAGSATLEVTGIEIR